MIEAELETTDGLAAETWIDRAAVLLKDLLGRVPEGDPHHAAIEDLLVELGDDYFTEPGAGAIDEASQEEPVAEDQTAEEKLAFTIAMLETFYTRAAATPEAETAVADWIATCREGLTVEQNQAAQQWVAKFVSIAFPA